MHFKSLFISLIGLLFLLTSFSISKTKLIKGQVSIYDSKAKNGRIKFVQNVTISSPTSRTVYTDGKGRFKFKLENVNPSEPLFMQIQKSGYEVVNQRDVKYFVLDKKTWLKVYVTERGYIRKARNILMASVKETLQEQKEKLLDQLAFRGKGEKSAIEFLEKKLGKKFYHTSEAEDLLISTHKKLEEQLKYCSYELVVVNPDEATDEYLEAQQLYRKGNFKKAIAKLQTKDLDKRANDILTKIEKLENKKTHINRLIESQSVEIEQIKNNYIFQLIALQQSFRLTEAQMVLKKITKLNDATPNRKYAEMIERLDIFQINSQFDIDENVLLKKDVDPVVLEDKTDENPQLSDLNISLEKNTEPISLTKFGGSRAAVNLNQTNENQQLQAIKAYNSIENKNIGKVELPNSQSALEKKISSTAKNNSVQFQQEKPTQQHLNLENQIQQNNVNTIISNNGTTTVTITTTITTTPNGEIHVTGNTSQPEVVNLLQKMPTENKSYNLKGFQRVEKKAKKNDDFETIIFPKKNTASAFKSFVEKEVQEN